VVADDLDHALDRVGGLDGVDELAADPEPVDRERLGQALAEAGSRAGPLARQAAGEGLRLLLGLLGVLGCPGRPQPPLDQEPFGLGEVVEHVAFLMPAAPLDQRLAAEHVADRGG
jgi:hypothetical protein